MGAENYVQILIDSLKKKEAILNQIVNYNEEQKNIITAASFDEEAFQANVDNKGDLVEEILKLDEGFNAVFARVKEQVEAHKSELAQDIATLQQLVKRVTDLGVRIQAQELRNKELVEKCFSDMRKELNNAKSVTSKANAYYKNANNLNNYDAHFLDQKK